MAVISGISPLTASAASAVSLHNDLHSTFSSTDMVVNVSFIEGNEAFATDPQRFAVSHASSANCILIAKTSATGSNSDVRAIVGGVVMPGAITDANVSSRYLTGAAPAVSIWMNISGIENSSVAAATNYIDEAVIIDASSSATLSSGGTSGNDLFIVACAQGFDMGPPTVTGFTSVTEGTTGSGASDFYYYIGQKAAGSPGGASVDWLTSNESTAILLELVNTGGAASVVPARRRRM